MADAQGASGRMIAGGHIDSLLEQVVFEDNETGVDGRGVTQDVVPIEKHLADGCDTTSYTEVCNALSGVTR